MRPVIWLLTLLMLNQASGVTTDLPPVPDHPVNSRYRAVEGADFKTETELKAMGLKKTGQHMVRYRCTSSCLSVSYVHAIFYGKDEAGSRMLYVCPNPAKNLDLGQFPPPPAPPYPGGWKCYLPGEVTDLGGGSNG